MKLIIKDGKIAATATDAYTGPEAFIDAPEDFDISQMGDYRYEGGELALHAPMRITTLAFRNRFTQGEKVAIEIASMDNPAADMPERVQAATLRAFVKDVEAATFIDLERQDTIAGVQALEAAGLIDEGRAEAILTDPIQPHERPL